MLVSWQPQDDFVFSPLVEMMVSAPLMPDNFGQICALLLVLFVVFCIVIMMVSRLFISSTFWDSLLVELVVLCTFWWLDGDGGVVLECRTEIESSGKTYLLLGYILCIFQITLLETSLDITADVIQHCFC